MRSHTYSEYDITHSRCHVIYSACDVMNTVHVMLEILRVVVIKFGYDVLYSAYDGIHMPPVMSYIVGVMSFTEQV